LTFLLNFKRKKKLIFAKAEYFRDEEGQDGKFALVF